MMLRSALRRAAASRPALSGLRAASTVADAYRRWGHLEAQLDPLGLQQRPARAELSAAAATDPSEAERLRQVYCGALGAEFEYLESSEERAWWAEHLETLVPEGAPGSFSLSAADRRNIHALLTQGEQFELFLGKKFTSFKRYSGEGADTMLPAVKTLLNAAASLGAKEAVIGQAHRGRLALQVSLLRYPARKLFWKIQGNDDFPAAVQGVDDVSSHISVSSEVAGAPWGSGAGLSAPSSAAPSLHVSYLPNPSHLEAVNPVAQGKTRAKMDAGSPSVCVLIHGDAAVAGQGVVAETALLANLPGYSVGGTLHVITNNQVGFTAEGERAGRSSTYASDFAKLIGAPVLHVNAESVREVVLACRLAAEYRARFGKDVVLDLIGYRKHGHNEVDEPAFTSPSMYAAIRARKSFPATYAESLEAEGALQAGERDKLIARLHAHLEAEFQAAKEYNKEGGSLGTPKGELGSGTHVVGDATSFGGKWAGMRQAAPAEVGAAPSTGVPVDVLRRVGEASVALPAGFKAHPRLLRSHVQARMEALGGEGSVDWATAEALAFGSLLLEGHPVRMSGQDSQRGTFSHRHAVLHDQATGATHTPLNHLSSEQSARLHIFSSPLSEFAVMGFELGYSWESPRPLVLWEAQFGDFGNGAQIIIDQFLSGSESKWLRQTGLTLLLPHGFDGAGPEHSSARIERFLQLANAQAWGRGAPCIAAAGAAGDKTVSEASNMLVLNPTTPANYFHLLRRQIHRPFRKPAVVIAPKVLLRHPAAVSSLSSMGPGTAFQPVLAEPATAPAAPAPGAASRVLLVSGKLYHELTAKRAELAAAGNKAAAGTALLRVEQLCPWPAEEIAQAIAAATGGRDAPVTWVQEEPANAGAFAWAEAHFAAAGLPPLRFVGRPSLPAPAVGMSKANKAQQDRLLAAAFD